jgi:hypothetical protein
VVFSFSGRPKDAHTISAIFIAFSQASCDGALMRMSSKYTPATVTPNDFRMRTSSALTIEAYAGADFNPNATANNCL